MNYKQRANKGLEIIENLKIEYRQTGLIEEFRGPHQLCIITVTYNNKSFEGQVLIPDICCEEDGVHDITPYDIILGYIENLIMNTGDKEEDVNNISGFLELFTSFELLCIFDFLKVSGDLHNYLYNELKHIKED